MCAAVQRQGAHSAGTSSSQGGAPLAHHSSGPEVRRPRATCGSPVAPAEGCWGDCRTEGYSPQECPKPHFPHRRHSARGHWTPAISIFFYSQLTCLRQSVARTAAPASPSLQCGKFCKPSRDCQTSQELQQRTRMQHVKYP
ncbi:hypothetical protein GWK47_034173 [Chionoecetes opilio]|uniref:Uncharacterized protein n=1 Tax=Chionoecetes opilio TaxID=41210 RepID=A0A8J4YHS1_CHIOP|nr:hypothetical protein GWK47_034173 [Chionoecetes opilio]